MRIWKYIVALILLACAQSLSHAQSSELKRKTLEMIAHKDYNPTFSAIAAQLTIGTDDAKAYKQLDAMLDREYGDMFWMYGCAGLYFSCKDILPDSYREKIRECWKKFTPYRGDTENHFLMYYGSLFLMSEEWDSLDASEWFMGRSSQEIRFESKEWLEHWIDETVKSGQTEFDSPRYLYYYITPLILLAEYSRDTLIKKKTSMMLEWMLASYASKYMNGSYVGAHSRESNESALMPISGEAISYGEYFFEDSVRHILPDVAFAAMSSFEIPKVIRDITQAKKVPIECTEIVRSRRRIRFEKPPIKKIKKYTYLTNSYALGSVEGGIVQPIQQRTWSLVLNSSQKNNAIIGLHPYFSAQELGTFFPEEPAFMLEKIEGVKQGYVSEDKWVGASPYETIWQRRNELRCSYNIPQDAPHRHVDLFFPDWGNIVDCDSTIWRQLTINYDSVRITLNTKTDFSLTHAPGGYRVRLRLQHNKTSYWLSVINKNDSRIINSDANMFSGKDVYQDQEFDNWLIHSPFVESKYGSGILKIHCGAYERILDFVKATTEDRFIESGH